MLRTRTGGMSKFTQFALGGKTLLNLGPWRERIKKGSVKFHWGRLPAVALTKTEIHTLKRMGAIALML